MELCNRYLHGTLLNIKCPFLNLPIKKFDFYQAQINIFITIIRLCSWCMYVYVCMYVCMYLCSIMQNKRSQHSEDVYASHKV
jgi:hypothetical protein